MILPKHPYITFTGTKTLVPNLKVYGVRRLEFMPDGIVLVVKYNDDMLKHLLSWQSELLDGVSRYMNMVPLRDFVIGNSKFCGCFPESIQTDTSADTIEVHIRCSALIVATP